MGTTSLIFQRRTKTFPPKIVAPLLYGALPLQALKPFRRKIFPREYHRGGKKTGKPFKPLKKIPPRHEIAPPYWKLPKVAPKTKGPKKVFTRNGPKKIFWPQMSENPKRATPNTHLGNRGKLIRGEMPPQNNRS